MRVDRILMKQNLLFLCSRTQANFAEFLLWENCSSTLNYIYYHYYTYIPSVLFSTLPC